MIEGGGVTLRPWEAPDVAFLYDACQDPEIQRWTQVPSPYEPHHAVEFVAFAETEALHGRSLHLAVTATETGELLGSVALHDLAGRPDRVEAGYWIAAEARGRGVATAALETLTRFAFDDLGFDELRLQIFEGNGPSEAVARRAGFTCVGTGAEPSSGRPVTLWSRRRAS